MFVFDADFAAMILLNRYRLRFGFVTSGVTADIGGRIDIPRRNIASVKVDVLPEECRRPWLALGRVARSC